MPSAPLLSNQHGALPAAPFSMVRYAFLLGLLTAAGPIGTDLYLPFFPAIQRALSASASQLQLSLVSYFSALALGQLVYGPVADRYGRRMPLLIGFAIFLAASVGAALTTSIDVLIYWRFVQGIGACAGMVVARSIARDLGSGERVAKLFALTALVLGVSPILAPSLGASLLSVFPWQAAFWVMAGIAAACLLVIRFNLPETLSPDHRQADLASAFAGYKRLLADRSYLRAVLTGAFALAGFFAYLAGSPDVLLGLHQLSPTQYSLLFGLNAIAMIGSSQLAAPLLGRMPAERIVGAVTAVYALLALILLGATVFRLDGLIPTALLFCLISAGMGLLFPIMSMQAVEHHPDAAGAASALMGAIQFGFGALASALLSAISDGSARPLALTIAACALLAVTTHYLPRFVRHP